jgi:ABC-type sugar transport system permease subunit
VTALGGNNIVWRDSVFWMYFFIIAIVTWSGIGGTALLFIAGLNGISREIYEAAEIDGVNAFQKILCITLPLLKPMTGFILITGFIGSFNVFEPVMLVSEGGPDSATKVVLYRIYDEAFKNFNQGLSNALSVLVFVLVFILTLFNIRFTDSSIIKMARRGGKQ